MASPNSAFFSATLEKELDPDQLQGYSNEELRYAYADVCTALKLRRDKLEGQLERLGHPNWEDRPEHVQRLGGSIYALNLWRKALVKEISIRKAEELFGESSEALALKQAVKAARHQSDVERQIEANKQRTERMAIQAALAKQNDRLFIEALRPLLTDRLGDEAKELFKLAGEVARKRLKELEEQEATNG